MGAKHLTVPEKKTIRKMYQEGKSAAEIAEAPGRSVPPVRRVINGKRGSYKKRTASVAGDTDWKSKYLGAVAKLAEHGLI